MSNRNEHDTALQELSEWLDAQREHGKLGHDALKVAAQFNSQFNSLYAAAETTGLSRGPSYHVDLAVRFGTVVLDYGLYGYRESAWAEVLDALGDLLSVCEG